MSQKPKKDYLDEFNEASDPIEENGSEASGREEFAALLNESLKSPKRKLKVGDKIRGKILVLGKEETYVSTGTQNDGVIQTRELLDAEGNCPWKRDDVIELYVAQVRGGEIRLSKKASGGASAEEIEDAFDMMLPISGRVVELCKGGVRVNIKGKLAFCPISQLDLQHTENGEEFVGKTLEFRVTQFSEGGKNIVVSRRKLLEEERELGTASFLEEHKDGDVVSGRVTRLERFGAFVELAPGVDGLVHISEIAWSRIGDPAEILQVGQTVQVKLLKREILDGRAKISLSIKQVTPRESAAEPKFARGAVIEGKVTRKEPYGLFVQLEPGIVGLLHKSRTFDHPEFQFEKFKVNDSIRVQVEEIKEQGRQISLGLPRDADSEDWKSHASSTGVGSFGTLGDQLKAALAKKKS